MSAVRRHLVSYAACGLVFLALDAAWLTLTAEWIYRGELGPLLAPAPRLAPAAIFYLVYLAGVVGFCVAPALSSGRPAGALARGGAFGLVAYATYDLTNQATLITWSSRITALDLVWGAFVTAVSAGAAAAVAHRLTPAPNGAA